MKIITSDCDCEVMGFDYTEVTDEETLVRFILEHIHIIYWAVHFNGKHVLRVQLNSGEWIPR